MSELKNETIFTRLNPYRVFRELVFAIAILLKCITLPDVYPIENTCYP